MRKILILCPSRILGAYLEKNQQKPAGNMEAWLITIEKPNKTNFEEYDHTMGYIYDKNVYETRDYLSLKITRKLPVSWTLMNEASLRQLIERQKTRLPCLTKRMLAEKR